MYIRHSTWLIPQECRASSVPFATSCPGSRGVFVLARTSGCNRDLSPPAACALWSCRIRPCNPAYTPGIYTLSLDTPFCFSTHSGQGSFFIRRVIFNSAISYSLPHFEQIILAFKAKGVPLTLLPNITSFSSTSSGLQVSVRSFVPSSPCFQTCRAP